MKLNVVQRTGKLTGKLVGVTKSAPTKTKNGLVSAKDQFISGFKSGSQSGK